MEITAELRWWSEKPEEFLSWFHQLRPGGHGTEEVIRTDCYFRLDTPGVGIKLREGLLEVKVRRALEKLPIGVLEVYAKESHKSNLDNGDMPGKGLLAVTKKRWLKTYHARESIWTAKVDKTNQGCEFEYSEVEISSRKYYSVCLEARDTHTNNPQKLLKEIIDMIDLPKEVFKCSNAMGYAEFLHTYLKANRLF